jgi:hypothetical protein
MAARAMWATTTHVGWYAVPILKFLRIRPKLLTSY